MPLKSKKPDTPSQRGVVLIDRSSLWKGRPLKKLTHGMAKTGGRNNLGRITSRGRGPGHKQLYRVIDFKRRKLDVGATVERIEFDPNRTTFIALLHYDDGEYSYILAPSGLKPGDRVIASEQADIKPGNALPLRQIPMGTLLHNIEFKPGAGGKMARAAGAYAQLSGKISDYALLKLRSGEVRYVSLKCMATIGTLSNGDHQNIVYGKAGRRRWLGRRPMVRGVAMNPIDHPHGGGEGKTAAGRHPVTPWGKPTKGYRTRKNKRTTKHIVKRRYMK